MLVITAVAVFSCVLALTLSVWGRKTHEVLMATYVIGIVYLLAPVLLGILHDFLQLYYLFQSPTTLAPIALVLGNPVSLALAGMDFPAGTSPINFETQLLFFAFWMLASALLIALSSWRIRAVVVRQMGQGARPPSRTSRRARLARRLEPLFPTLRIWGRRTRWLLDLNPVFWRECQRRRLSWMSWFIRGVYVLLSGGFTLLFANAALDNPSINPEMAIVANPAMVAVGLLLLCVSAATSLAEERQRGSLDVLLATTMSTRSIVLGKWLGAFRGVPWLLTFPMILTYSLSLRTGRIEGVVLMAALIVAYGAAVTSLGVGLATWVPRLGRAVGLSVGLFVGMTLGWIVLSAVLLTSAHDQGTQGLMAGSPLTGVGYYSAMIAGDGRFTGGWEPRERIAMSAWIICWTIAYAGVGLGLLLLTTQTFDGCLGRIREPLSHGDRWRSTSRHPPDSVRDAS